MVRSSYHQKYWTDTKKHKHLTHYSAYNQRFYLQNQFYEAFLSCCASVVLWAQRRKIFEQSTKHE